MHSNSDIGYPSENRNDELVAQALDLVWSDRRLIVDEVAGEVSHIRSL
jgi:hypothetical protein